MSSTDDEDSHDITIVSPLTLIAFVTLVAPVGAAAQDPVACGPKDEKHEVIKHKVAPPVPAPAAGKAMVVIVLGGSFTEELSAEAGGERGVAGGDGTSPRTASSRSIQVL